MYSAVRCGVVVMAMAAAFGSTRIFASAAQPSDSRVAAQANLTAPVEEQSDLSKVLARGTVSGI